jgi:hypothetical protein
MLLLAVALSKLGGARLSQSLPSQVSVPEFASSYQRPYETTFELSQAKRIFQAGDRRQKKAGSCFDQERQVFEESSYWVLGTERNNKSLEV